jgi:hypothetical protein
MNLFNLFVKLPLAISGIMAIIEKTKLPGVEKKAAVLAAIPESIVIMELLAGRDILNDPIVASLISDFIDAEAKVINIKNKLKALIVAHEAATQTVSPLPQVA